MVLRTAEILIQENVGQLTWLTAENLDRDIQPAFGIRRLLDDNGVSSMFGFGRRQLRDFLV
jgi:hypothetical protein